MGRDPDIDAIKARQSLGLPLTGRLTEQQVKRAHKLLAVKHHPDKGGDPELMTRYNNARDALLEPGDGGHRWLISAGGTHQNQPADQYQPTETDNGVDPISVWGPHRSGAIPDQ